MSTRSDRIDLTLVVDTITLARTRAELAQRTCDLAAAVVAGARITYRDVPGPDGYVVAPESPEERACAVAGELVLSTGFGDEYAVVAVKAGAAATALLQVFAPIAAEQAEAIMLIAAVAAAVLGRIEAEEGLYSHAERLRRLRREVLELENRLVEEQAGSHSDRQPEGFGASAELLTDREREVFARILTGASNAEIADELVVSIDTVKTHVKRILRKLGAANRAELIARHS